MMYTQEQVIKEIERYGGEAHEGTVTKQWEQIDDYYKRRADIELPEVTHRPGGDIDSLERLFLRTNFAKTIVSTTATMSMAAGIPVYNPEGIRDLKAERTFVRSDVRRLLRYVSRYGAGWLQAMPEDKTKPYRTYKPHVARRVMMDEDEETERGVLVIQRFTNLDNKEYRVARWYEWDDKRERVLRRDFISEGTGSWQPRGDERWFGYMPFIYVPNRLEDSIPEQSDIIDGLDTFKQYDALRVKFLKALEDESFRLIFLANVGEEVAKNIQKAGGLQVWYAKNKVNEAPPELQSVPPADQRQFLDAERSLVNSLATVTRTSVLELNERPVQDIPAQTLRVLYGPQIERCTETVEHVNPALTRVIQLIHGGDGWEVRLQPLLPISEDKQHQNRKGLLDSGAYSAHQLLRDSGKSDAEAERIFTEYLEEQRRKGLIKVDEEIEVVEAEARAKAENEVERDPAVP